MGSRPTAVSMDALERGDDAVDRHTLRGEVLQRHRAVALGEALTVGADHERDVQVPRLGQPEQALQLDLAGRRCQQVVAAHDDVDALGGVVDDDGEVVRRHAVVAPQHDVVGHAGVATGDAVVERDRLPRRPQPQRGRSDARGAPSAPSPTGLDTSPDRRGPDRAGRRAASAISRRVQ